MIFWMQSLISNLKVTSTSPGIPAPVRYKSSQSARVCWSANTPKGISSKISKSRGFRSDPVKRQNEISKGKIPWIMVHRNFHLNIAKQTTPKTWQYHTFSTEDFNPLNLLHLIFSRTWDWVVYRFWLLSFVLFSKHLVAAFVWLSATYPAVELHGSQGTIVTRQNLSKIIISFFILINRENPIILSIHGTIWI